MENLNKLSSNSVFIVAEMSANHGFDIDIAKNTIKAAKEAGADAIKLQTYTPDTITIDCDNDYFKINSGTIWDGTTLYNLYKTAYTPWEWHKELFEYAKSIDLICFSSPFDKTAVDLLETCNCPSYKIASFEITDIPLIEYAASKGKPMIISTGIATEEEIFDAVNACKKNNNNQITLLKCTSEYPAKIEDANLSMIPDMRKRFGVDIGVSDHSIGSLVPIVSVALGAKVIEKHFILDKNIGGPDASFSMTPHEFKDMVSSVRQAEKSFGKIDYDLNEKKLKSRRFARSLFIVKDMKKGDILTEENVRSIRPSNGISPKYYDEVMGLKVCCDIDRGTPLTKELIERVGIQ